MDLMLCSELKLSCCAKYTRCTWLLQMTFPASGVSKSMRIFNKVDFPEPLGPIKPMRSWAKIPREMLENKGSLPKDFSMAWVLISSVMVERVYQDRKKFHLSPCGRGRRQAGEG